MRGLLMMSLQPRRGTRIKILVDSGATHTVLDKKLCQKLPVKYSNSSNFYSVPGKGTVQTSQKCKIHLELPQLSTSLIILKEVVVMPNLSSNYNMILGRDLISELGLMLDFKEHEIQYKHLTIPMESAKGDKTIHFATNIQEPQATQEAVDRIKDILDAKYAPVTCQEILDKKPHLTDTQKTTLKSVLEKHIKLFDGSLGKLIGFHHKLEL